MEYQSGAVSPVGSIREGWEIIKDDYWTIFAMTLTAAIILVVLSIILGTINNVITFALSAALGGATNNSGDAVKISAGIAPQLISSFIGLFTNIIVGAVSGAFFCGIYKTLSKKASGASADFGDLFGGFQKIQQCLIVAAIMALVQFVITLVGVGIGAAAGVSLFGLGVFKGGQPNPAAFGGLFLVVIVVAIVFVIVSLIISALTTLTYPLIADRDLSGGEALITSVKAGFSNLGGLILLLILTGLMMLVGAIACLVGILFVMPIAIAAIFAAYQSVFGGIDNFYRNTPPSPPIFDNQPGY